MMIIRRLIWLNVKTNHFLKLKKEAGIRILENQNGIVIYGNVLYMKKTIKKDCDNVGKHQKKSQTLNSSAKSDL